MQIQTDNEQGAARFQLGDSLCIFDVAALHEQLLREFPEVTEWQWDLSGIEECDSAGLQWLLMIKDWARREQRTCEFESPSDALMEMIDLYRVHGAMGLTTVMPADEPASGRR
ncbi:STAS domain-containing protein [Marinobacteraceae bacterium S3BR75-40.1]